MISSWNRHYYVPLISSFPDIHFTVEDELVEGGLDGGAEVEHATFEAVVLKLFAIGSVGRLVALEQTLRHGDRAPLAGLTVEQLEIAPQLWAKL